MQRVRQPQTGEREEVNWTQRLGRGISLAMTGAFSAMALLSAGCNESELPQVPKTPPAGESAIVRQAGPQDLQMAPIQSKDIASHAPELGTGTDTKPIPFIRQPEERNCVQTNIKMVLDYFGKGRGTSIRDIEKSTGLADPATGQVDRSKMSWTIQGIKPLVDAGLDVEVVSAFPYKQMMAAGRTQGSGTRFLQGHYGKKMGDWVSGVTEWDSFYNAVGHLESSGGLRQVDASSKKQAEAEFKRIEGAHKDGAVAMLLVDRRFLDGNMDLDYQGHFVTVTGITDREVTYHDTGKAGGANQKVSRDKFIDAWRAQGTDNDALIVRPQKAR